ncbi:MAG: penicillin-binding transpeptidase domain-containing protein [Clostridia bacterium]
MGDTFNISIGQGDNAYTTLQMASYMSALANGGARKPVTLTASRKQQGRIGAGGRNPGDKAGYQLYNQCDDKSHRR